MIQRIQSLYLFLAAALMAVMLFVPLAEDGHGSLTAFSPEFDLVPGLLLCLGALLPFVAIFLFKRRKAQMRMCRAAMVLQLAGQLAVGFFLWKIMDSEVVFSPVCVLPLVCIVLTWLALRAIRRDEALVRSIDRIR